MSKLSRKDILAVQDLPTQDIEVPEWGGYVTVRGMTGAERDEYEQGMLEMAGPSVSLNMHNARAKLVAKCCVEEDGSRTFTDEDIEALSRKSGAALDRVYTVVQRLSGLSESDMKELTANFFGQLIGGSSSD